MCLDDSSMRTGTMSLTTQLICLYMSDSYMTILGTVCG